MTDKAKLVFDKDQLQIGWDYGDGDGINCYLGEGLDDVHSNFELNDRDMIAAELALEAIAVSEKGWERRGSGPWVAPSVAAGRQALAACKRAVKAELSKKAPLSDWEKKAIHAGWKPPKGRL